MANQHRSANHSPGATRSKSPRVVVREATESDIPEMIKLNRAAYPVLKKENVVWGETHLRSHQRVFPQGQLMAESGGKLLGACASLIVDMGPDPLRHHNWAGITDSGYFTNHNLNADTLYGADVYVHPEEKSQTLTCYGRSTPCRGRRHGDLSSRGDQRDVAWGVKEFDRLPNVAGQVLGKLKPPPLKPPGQSLGVSRIRFVCLHPLRGSSARRPPRARL